LTFPLIYYFVSMEWTLALSNSKYFWKYCLFKFPCFLCLFWSHFIACFTKKSIFSYKRIL